MTNTDLKAQINSQITNETTENGITPAEVGGNLNAIVDYVDQEKRPYKLYSCVVNQAGVNAPTVTILENNLGVITWSRFAAGRYFGVISGGNTFVTGKTLCLPDKRIININGGGQAISAYIDRFSDTQVTLYTTLANAQADDLIVNLFVELRVYN